MNHSENINQPDKFELREPMQFGDERFVLTESQIKQLNEWVIGVEQRAAAIQAAQIKQKIKYFSEGGEVDEICQGMTSNHYSTFFSRHALPYYGSIGGGFSFTFTPLGIGMGCSVTESITGESIDLSEYDSW